MRGWENKNYDKKNYGMATYAAQPYYDDCVFDTHQMGFHPKTDLRVTIKQKSY